jgi:hypothetical protein
VIAHDVTPVTDRSPRPRCDGFVREHHAEAIGKSGLARFYACHHLGLHGTLRTEHIKEDRMKASEAAPARDA